MPGNGDPFFYHAQANMLADGIGFGEPIQWLTENRFVASAIYELPFGAGRKFVTDGAAELFGTEFGGSH